ncbi:hypothetical protein Csa_009026 [Cucumis sativus]|nr:hypothetical protein Csa_009026 [Cucumis sativus]
MEAQETEKSEGSKNIELPVEESDESDEDNVSILKRKLYIEMKKSKRISQQS